MKSTCQEEETTRWIKKNTQNVGNILMIVNESNLQDGNESLLMMMSGVFKFVIMVQMKTRTQAHPGEETLMMMVVLVD